MTNETDAYTYYDDPEKIGLAGPGVEPTRPARLSSHLPIRFQPEVLAAARRLAAEDGVSISTWIRSLVEREVLRRNHSWTMAGEPPLHYESMATPSSHSEPLEQSDRELRLVGG